VVRLAKGQGSKEDSVDHTKNGSGCADAKGESENRNDGKAGSLAQGAERKAKVLEQSLKERKAASFTVLLFGLLRAAEADERLSPRFIGREAALKIFFGGKLHMRGNFRVKVAIELIAAEEGKQALE
jgi:hypothetical protein